MQHRIQKATALHESLVGLTRAQGQTFVIKYGGHAMVDETLCASFALDVALLSRLGVRLVVVHGGGPQIKRELDRRALASRFVDGLRVTDDATMEVVEDVLGARVNGEIVRRIEASGARARGFRGSEGGLLQVRARQPELGRVGEVCAVNVRALRAQLEAGVVPVVAPLGADADGRSHNVNADEAAGALAGALGAAKLVLLTDVAGVARADGEPARRLDAREIRALRESGAIGGGMIPKVECCQRALRAGVGSARITDGRVQHALLLEIFADSGFGTQIHA